jgi:P27 family predicted phage terminase small subunit
MLQGNPGRRPLNEKEPQFRAAGTKPPEWLSGYAREEWNRLAPMLIEQGVLTEADRELFATGCERYGVYRQAVEQVDTLLVESKSNGWITNPLHALAKSALADAMAVFREFGIGASSRSKVTVSKPAADDEFARRFG